MKDGQPKAPEEETGVESISSSTQGEGLDLEMILISAVYLMTRKQISLSYKSTF